MMLTKHMFSDNLKVQANCSRAQSMHTSGKGKINKFMHVFAFFLVSDFSDLGSQLFIRL